MKRLRLISCNGVNYDLPLLYHFIKHYISLGIDPDQFLLVFNALSNEHPNLNEAESIAKQFGIQNTFRWIGTHTSQLRLKFFLRLLKEHTKPGDWVIYADADEFHFYPDRLEEVLQNCDSKGQNAIQGVFVDRISANGTLTPTQPTPTIYEQYPTLCNCNAIWYETGNFPDTAIVKILAYKSGMKTTTGGHVIRKPDESEVKYALECNLANHKSITDTEFREKIPFQVHHFKWNANLIDKCNSRIETFKQLGKPWGMYPQRIVEYFQKHKKIDLNTIELFKDQSKIFPN